MPEGLRDPSGVRQPAGGPVSDRSSPGPQTGYQRAWSPVTTQTATEVRTTLATKCPLVVALNDARSDGNVPDVAKLPATDGDVRLPVDEIVVARDSRSAGRRAQFTHRLRRLDDVRYVLQERLPVTRVLATHGHLLAEESAVSIAEDAEPLSVFSLVHVTGPTFLSSCVQMLYSPNYTRLRFKVLKFR